MKDIKIKGLRPTLRIKKRFLLIKYTTEVNSKTTQMDEKKLLFEINNHLLNILGTHQFGEFGVWFVKEQCDMKHNLLVLKVTTSGVEKVSAALSLGLTAGQNNVRCSILKVSGTLRGINDHKKKLEK
ncbi:MAG: hypothetical protein LAT82_01400 [Nanoarchaeota archaeon]|nr:hypothetical protein [Nanoarchaeota archaeon]